MHRAKYKFILQVIGIDNARKLLEEFGSEKITFKGVVHEHNLQQLEQGLTQFDPDNKLMRKGKCSRKTVTRYRKKFLGKKALCLAFIFCVNKVLFVLMDAFTFDLSSLNM